MSERPKNIAYRLADMFITSKLTILTIIAVTIFGLIAIYLTPREENPQIVIPSAQITVALPGASALEIEQLIVTPLEGIVSEILGVDHTYGTAMNSVGVITVQFKAGENKEDSLVKLYTRILASHDRLPRNAGQPVIKSLDVDDIAIVTVTLASKTYNDFALKRIADRMTERLHSLNAVSVVKVKGGRDREIRIDLDPERLQTFGIPLARVRDTLAASNLALPVGDYIQNGQSEAVYLQGFFQDGEDVRKLIIGLHESRPIYLGDIANITDGPPLERDLLSRFSFGSGDPRYSRLGGENLSAVTLAVAKKKGTNAVFMADDVLRRIERMRVEFVPDDVHVVVTRNDGKKADDAVNVLIEHLGIAVSTVFLVLILFLGWKEALIVTIAVPLVFFVTMGADLLGGVTINKVSLFALILSLGLLVDDAIVVIENIHRHYFKNGGRKNGICQDKRQMTVEASAEVGGAANLATATVMAVFASLFLVTDMPGQYFYPVAFNVPIAMAASLFFAYTVTPWAAYRWLRRPEINVSHDQKQHQSQLSRLYKYFILQTIKKKNLRWSLLGATLVLIVLSMLQPAWQFARPEGVTGPKPFFGVALGFMPKSDKNTFSVAIEMPETTPVETTDAIARDINQLLVQNPLVTNTMSWIGQTGIVDFPAFLRGTGDQKGPHIAQIRVNLIDKHARDATSMEIVRKLRSQIDKIRMRYKDSVVLMVEDPPGPASRATILAEIYGKDREMLRMLSKKVSTAFKKTYDMVDISDTEPFDVPENRIIVDKEKAALSGVSNAQVAEILRVLFDGEIVGRVHPPGEKNAVPIRVRVPHKYRLDPQELDRVFVENSAGKRIPLSELVHVVMSKKDRPILHKDNERVTFIGGELARTVPIYAILDLDKKLDGMDLGNGLSLETRNLTLKRVAPDTIGNYQLLWDGEIRLTLDTFRDMGFALSLALMLVFLLLVAYYHSFSIPIVAMSSIPLGLIGVFPGHWIMGADFSSTSMVGIIALAGVAIRSALLIIDFARENRMHGMSLHEAAYTAGTARALPILLTTLAVILGSAIMLTDPVFGGLAISLIFGTAVSSALAIIIVPVLYYFVEKWREKRDIRR